MTLISKVQLFYPTYVSKSSNQSADRKENASQMIAVQESQHQRAAPQDQEQKPPAVQALNRGRLIGDHTEVDLFLLRKWEHIFTTFFDSKGQPVKKIGPEQWKKMFLDLFFATDPSLPGNHLFGPLSLDNNADNKNINNNHHNHNNH